MASFFQLELDTTPPTIEINSPNYAIKGSETEIRVIGNESLSTYQDIYYVDSDNVKHDLTFILNDNEYVGKLDFNNSSYGITTIYAQLKDVVSNTSSLVSKTIEITKGGILTLDINDLVRDMEVVEDVIDITTSQRGMKIAISEKTREVKEVIKIREVTTRDSGVK